MAEPSAASLAEELRDRYRLERELGRGGMATVYLARDLRHDRWVALKLLRPELAAPRSTTRFQREIRLTARLEHPGLLPLFDSGEIAGQLWYTMPFEAGGTLRDRLRRTGPLSVAEAVGLVQAVLAALDYAHRRGIIHRDLKPENILLAPSGPLIADFGIARALDVVGERLTETGIALGTPEYMSPEQVAGRGVDGRSDLYSVATILYELLTGEPPYTGPNAQAVIAKRLTEPVPRVSILRPDVPPALERALARALAKAPADRYATAGELGAALGAALAGRPVPMAAPPRRLPRRQRVWVAAAALVLVIGSLAALLLRTTEPVDPNLNPELVAVLPFTVTAPDSASNYLREGVVDLLNARLTGEGMPRAVDTRTTLAHWRRIGHGRELTTPQALEVARGLGAGQLILGKVVRTAEQMSVTGRVLRVPSGELGAEHTEIARAGEMDELGLIDRWLSRIFAVGLGEGIHRLPTLSDSTEAVKAYLAGRRAHDSGEFETAAAHYHRALDIDSAFALAAYWLVLIDAHRGSLSEGIQQDLRRAWALRERLSERDRALLVASLGIGPRYPERYTSAELMRAAERAAELNPDRPEAVGGLGMFLVLQGASASVDRWLQRAIVALDSSIALDSTYGDPIWWRLYAALIQGNREDARRFSSLYFRTRPRAEWGDAARWMTAYALEDSVAIEQVQRISRRNFFEITGVTAHLGLPLDPLDRMLGRIRPSGEAEWECGRFGHLQRVAGMRGQVARALALADSANRMPGCGLRRQTMAFALADPGYGSGPDRAAKEVLAFADSTSEDPGAICLAEQWRISRGDTLGTRRSIERMTPMLRNSFRPVPVGVGTLGVCVRLLEAAVERFRAQSGPAPALERLDSLMRQGVFLEDNFANLALARWFADRGEFQRGLAAARRLGYHPNANYAALRPAYLLEEGRLAALTGDTTGAIRAYQHYLRLRDRPNPGPMREQVDRVRAHLAGLVGEPRM